mmetsp:Transcript_25979/g.60724  ORF Transcript_25979/g.60724 Transcript_25979/m.60724 type:complete len:202 (+) Transcript_25979:374-979(+)
MSMSAKRGVCASPRPSMPRRRGARPEASVAMVKANSGSSPEALAFAIYLSATGNKHASKLFCSSALLASQKRSTVGTSLISPGPAFKLATGFGNQGICKPSGSALTAALPSFVTVLKSASRITKLGIPLTPKAAESFSLVLRSPKSNANQGCSAKYSLKDPSSLSEDTKITSKPFAFKSFLYHSASCGVKPRQGGHQCALK